MSEKFLLLRVSGVDALEQALENQRAQLLECFVAEEKPLLAELWQALQRRGLNPQQGESLYWCRFADDQSVDHYLDYNEVECCFSRAWLEQAAAEIKAEGGDWSEAVGRKIAAWPLKDPGRKLQRPG